ncbi:glycosyltransferase family 39 protein [Prochlorococcus sp. MIT 1223]|uniref:glycosyltransferase family 39 protein n=1 Tax=Prochlorococcus sp. MIT 1223 TaxID=3096217 RepID=UPI002A75816E|nr:glycosyltransferase family 39 protein [Prochlorococcus sp. MIT 1223]
MKGKCLVKASTNSLLKRSIDQLCFNRSLLKGRVDYICLFAIWCACFLFDAIWIHQNNLPPAWDQGSHLSKAFEINEYLNHVNLFETSWWNDLWAKFPSYRGPFTYLVSSPIFRLFGTTYKNAILTNQIFNGILIFSTYFLGRLIHSRNAGLWAAFLCAISPVFIQQRTDYLIDLSLASIINLTWLCLSLWRFKIFLSKWVSSILSGIFIGISFLTRPTGLIFFWLSSILFLLQFIHSLIRFKTKSILQSLVIILSSLIVAWPWFSENWLTIITSINKARRWGILYQDGLEANSLDGWLFYPKMVPTITGSLFIGLLAAGSLIAIYSRLFIRSNSINFSIDTSKLIWWISFPLGAILLCIFMSTKEIRFVLPILPQFFILIGIIITSIQTNWSTIWKKALIIISISGVFWTYFGIGINTTGLSPNLPAKSVNWPLDQIVETIIINSPYQLSTLAVLSDSKYLNAFNLDAEGKKQDNLVAARQTYYQSESFSDELSNFDWFLFKTGDQGIMSGENERKIAEIVKDSIFFSEERKWFLPDGSYAYLFRRKPLSIEVARSSCSRNNPILNFQNIPGGFQLDITDKARNLIKSHILIDLKDSKRQYNFDQSVAQGMLRFDLKNSNDCFKITQRFNSNSIILENDNFFGSRISLLNPDIYPVSKLLSEGSVEIKATNYSQQRLALNRIELVTNMGSLLRNGELDLLFAKAGQLNQGDPEQVYLENSEAIFNERLRLDENNLDYLYGLAISQILQKKVSLASKSLDLISEIDIDNQYVFLAKAFLDIYQFNPKLALISIDRAEDINNDPNIIDVLKTMRILAKIQSTKFLEAIALIKKT